MQTYDAGAFAYCSARATNGNVSLFFASAMKWVLKRKKRTTKQKHLNVLMHCRLQRSTQRSTDSTSVQVRKILEQEIQVEHFCQGRNIFVREL